MSRIYSFIRQKLERKNKTRHHYLPRLATLSAKSVLDNKKIVCFRPLAHIIHYFTFEHIHYRVSKQLRTKCFVILRSTYTPWNIAELEVLYKARRAGMAYLLCIRRIISKLGNVSSSFDPSFFFPKSVPTRIHTIYTQFFSIDIFYNLSILLRSSIILV